MANAYITAGEFENLLKRVEKLEHKVVEVPVDVSRDFDELKEKYYGLDKRTEVTDTKIDSLRIEMHNEFKSVRREMDERFNTTNEKISSIRTEIRVTFGILLTVMIAIAIKIYYFRL